VLERRGLVTGGVQERCEAVACFKSPNARSTAALLVAYGVSPIFFAAPS